MAGLIGRKMRSGVVSVTGHKIIPTGLQKLTSAHANISGSQVSDESDVKCVINDNKDGDLGLYTFKPTNSSTTTRVAGTTAVNVVWTAVGDEEEV